MSKIVKIPETMNPFEVHVNNKKYVYPAGTEQEVPDEVAVIIENHEDATVEPILEGSGRSVIDLDSYGINIAGLVMSGGGKLNIENTKEMWETINAKRNVVMTCVSGGEKFTLYPCVVGEMNGIASNVSMQLVATMGGVMITANIVFACSYDIADGGNYTYTGDTTLYVTVNQTAVS